MMTQLDVLPHGREFRFIDHLTDLDEGKSGVGVYEVRGDEDFLRGHFPGRPIVPGVILIEAIAQLGGIVAQSDASATPSSDLRLAAVRNAKIYGAAHPGEKLVINAEVKGRMGELIQIAGSVLLKDVELARAEVVLSGVGE